MFSSTLKKQKISWVKKTKYLLATVVEKYILVGRDFNSDIAWALFVTSAEHFHLHHFDGGMGFLFVFELDFHG